MNIKKILLTVGAIFLCWSASLADTVINNWTVGQTSLSTTAGTGIITVDIGGAGAGVTWGTAPFEFAGNQLTFNAGSAPFALNFVNPIDMGATTRTIQVDSTVAGATVTMSGSLTGAAGIVKNGAGILCLGGNSGYSGNNVINAGSLSGTSVNAAGTGQIQFNGSRTTFRIEPTAGNLTISNSFVFNEVGMLTWYYTTGVGDLGAIRNISGDNTITGGISLAETSQVYLGAGWTYDRNYYIGVDAGSLTISGEVTRAANGARTLLKVGAGTLIFGAADRFVGAIGLYVTAGGVDFGGYHQNIGGALTITGGTVDFRGVAPTLGGNLSVGSGATLDFGAAYGPMLTVPGTFTVGATATLLNTPASVNAGAFDYQKTGDHALSINITGAGTFYKNSSNSTLELAGDNSGHTGAIVIQGNESILMMRRATDIGSGMIQFNASKTTFRIDPVAGNITLSNNFRFNEVGQIAWYYTYGAGSLGAIRSISGDNILNGNIEMAETSTVYQGSGWVYDRNYYIGVDAGSLTLNGQVTRAANGYRTLLKVGAGSLIFGAADRFVGAIGLYVTNGTVDFNGFHQNIGGIGITMTGGTLYMRGVAPGFAGNLYIGSGATLDFGVGYGDLLTVPGTFTVGPTATLLNTPGSLIAGAFDYQKTGDHVLAINMSGAGTFYKNSSNSTLELAGDNSGHTGAIVIQGTESTLMMRRATDIGSGMIQFNASKTTFRIDPIAGNLTIPNNFRFNEVGQIAYYYTYGAGSLGAIRSISGDNILNGNIEMAETSLVYNGSAWVYDRNYYIGVDAGSLTLNGQVTRAANGYRTLLKVGAGSLIFGAADRFVGAIGLYVAGGTVDFNGFHQNIGGIGITMTGGTLYMRGVAPAFAGNLYIGSGATLDFGVGYGDLLTVPGTFTVGPTATLLNTPGSLIAGAFDYQKTGDHVLAINMSGAYTFYKNSSNSTVELSGDNSGHTGLYIIQGSQSVLMMRRQTDIGSGEIRFNATNTTFRIDPVADDITLSNTFRFPELGRLTYFYSYGAGNLGAIRSVSGNNRINGNIYFDETSDFYNGSAWTFDRSYYFGVDAGTLTITGQIMRAANGTRTIVKVGAGTLEFSQAERIVGAIGLYVSNGTVILPGANTFSGNVTLTNGMIQINDINGLGSGVFSFSGANSTLALDGGVSFNRSYSFGTAALGWQNLGVVRSISGVNTWDGNISATGNIHIGAEDGATLVWGGIISGLGAVRNLYKLGAGTLVFGSDDRISTANSNIKFYVGSGVGDYGGTVDLNGTSQLITNTVTFYHGHLLNSGVGAGSLTTTGAFTMYAGSIGGNMSVMAPSFTFSPEAWNEGISAEGNLQGVGPLTKNGFGTLSLSGTNTYSGPTYINRGALEATSGIGIGASSVIRFDDATGGILVTGGLFTRWLTTGIAGNNLIGWSAAGSGGFAGKGNNLQINLGGALAEVTWGVDGFAGAGVLTLGTLASDKPIYFYNPMNLGDAQRSIEVSSTSENFTMITGAITSSGASGGLSKYGSGLLILTNVNTYQGPTKIYGGILRAAVDSSLPANSLLEFDGGILECRGTMTRSIGSNPGDIRWVSGGGFAAVGGVLNLNFGGAFESLTWGSADFVQAGQDLEFGSENANRVVDLQNGLNLGGGIRTIKVNDNTGSSLDIARISGVISNGSLNKTGTGTLELTGDSTYVGATRVIEGILKVNGSVLSAVTVESGGKLMGSGLIAGAAINAGGILSPGNSPGTLYVDGDLTLFDGSVYEWEFLFYTPMLHDTMAVSGNLVLEEGWVLKIVPLIYQKSEYDETYELFTVGGTITFTTPIFDLSLVPGHWNTSDLLVYESGGTVYLTHLSGEPVPEPASLGILGLALLFAYKKRNQIKF